MPQVKRLSYTALSALALMIAFLVVAPARSAENMSRTFDHRKVAQAMVERHIQPTYANLLAALGKLRAATDACTGNANFDYGKVKSAFAETVLAWGRAAHLTFGPMAQENRYERIYFWLDRKGIARRQVVRALRNAPVGYTKAAELGTRSIGVQGLPAFELLMVTPRRAGADPAFKCGYARAIVANVAQIVGDVAAAWGDDGLWTKRFLSTGPKNSYFLKQEETTFLLARTYLQQVGRVRDVEFLRPMGFAVRGRVLRGPFARSDLTMPFLSARIAGLRAFLTDGNIISETRRTAKARNQPDAIQAISQVAFELEFSADLSSKLAKKENFFQSPARLEAVAIGFPLKMARVLAERAFALTMDIPMGFNASDGD